MIDKSMVTTASHLPEYTVTKSFGVVVGDEADGPYFAKFRRNVYDETYAFALNMLIERAEKLGANAIIGVGFNIFSTTMSTVSIKAYGTPVLVEKK